MSMTQQIASQALRRIHPLNPAGKRIGIGVQMEQLALDFESSNQILDAIEAESKTIVPNVLEVPIEPRLDQDGELQLSLDNGSYVQLAINLLLTCAEDLVSSEKVLSKPDVHTRTRNNALRLKEETIQWLTGELDGAPFTFSDCAALLEDELRYQSMGEVTLPAIAERSDEIAQWIINDPATAKDILGRYLTVFSRNEDEYLDIMDDLDDEPGYERSRPRA